MIDLIQCADMYTKSYDYGFAWGLGTGFVVVTLAALAAHFFIVKTNK